MIGIYKITNNVNGKCYIGQSINIEQRWKDHKRAAFNLKDSSYDYPLYRAMRKYDIKNFKFEVLEECNIEELNEKEIFYISKYDSYNRNKGYNQCVGGNSFSSSIKVTQELLGQIIQRLETTRDSDEKIAKDFGLSRNTIRTINLGETSYVDRSRIYPIREPLYKPKPDTFCEMCGKELSSSSSKYCRDCASLLHRKVMERPEPLELAKMIKELGLAEVSRKYNIEEGSVIAWCKNYGMPSTRTGIILWYNEQIGVNEKINIKEKIVRNKLIEQIDVNTNEVLAVFEGPVAAARALGLKLSACTGISKTCQGIQQESHGFKWKYADEEDIPQVKKKEAIKFCRPIRQIDPNTNKVVAVYNSIKEAKEAFKGQRGATQIIFACQGKRETVLGFRWEYANDLIKGERISIKRPVCQIDLITNEIISTYDSIKDAAMISGFKKSCIHKACCGIYKQSYNYKWRYLDPITNKIIEPSNEDDFVKLYHSDEVTKDFQIVKNSVPHNNLMKKAVHQIDIITNKIIATYDSVSAACRAINRKEGYSSMITAVCRGRKESASGFKWEFVDKNNLLTNDVGVSKAVYQLDAITGDIINRFNSVASAVRNLGLAGSTQICNVCNGRGHTAYGSKWCYVEDYIPPVPTSTPSTQTSNPIK